MNSLKLKDKIVLITGGNSGIGLATAKLFNKQGAKVIIVGRNEKTLALAKNDLGKNSFAIKADISKVFEIEKVIKEVKNKFGKIDILFANAGISECPKIEETTEEFFDSIININIKGVFFMFTKALPILNEGASVIFTSSVANKLARPGDPLYSATKAAVRSLGKTLAVDETVLRKKIRVNVVSPGTIKTPLTIQDDPKMEEAINNYIKDAVPMGRWGKAEEVAKSVLFLASSDSSYLTAGEIVVDGGLGEL